MKDTAPEPGAIDRSRRARRRRTLPLVAGVVAAVLLVAGVALYLDYRSFDQTSGGYDPPYDDWTGTPIDWSAAERTEDGFRQNGRVINSRLDCTTGMITLEVLFASVDYRQVSPRAIAVHQPREACEQAGFAPEF